MTRSATDAFQDFAAAGLRLPSNVFAYGFSLRKRSIVRSFLGEVRVRFVRHGKQVSPGGVLLIWGSGPVPEGLATDTRIIRMEDGFLRSVGLGADLIRPVSLVLDHRGIYYDSTGPSDLEYLLQTNEFPADLLERATALRNRIVEIGLTKYNVGVNGWKRPDTKKKVILVPGQVETDASMRYGAPGIHTNLELLRAIRREHPDAYVVYKPHPDVVAGLRATGRGEHEARTLCDDLVVDASMDSMLSGVDEVHVLTSLAGFEALMRGKKVTCYGQPFYSGWGLTNDRMPVSRRSRRLTLDMLVAGALILYPAYVSRTTDRFTTPEKALDELVAWRASCAAPLSPWRMWCRSVKRRFLRRP